MFSSSNLGIDFSQFNQFYTINNDDQIEIVRSSKKSTSKEYLFKIFKINDFSSKDQNVILQTFYRISEAKNRFLLTYKRLSFVFLEKSKIKPTFSMKLVSLKTLESVIQSPNLLQKWGIKNVLQCIFSVSNAMSYLEDNLIIHGNLCPSNIIYDEPDKFYVCDFGLYPIKELFLNEEKVFHKIYKDPSMKNNEPSFKTDVYSFGVLMCQLFLSYSQFEKDSTIISQDKLIEFISSSTRSKCEEIQIPKDFIKLIQSCLNSKAFDRPSFNQINESFKSMKTIKDKEEEIDISKLYNEFTDPNYLLKEPSETDSNALFKLGQIYEAKGEKEDKLKAAELYKKAADLNHPKAQNNYGVLIQELEKDNKEKLKEGAKYLKMSAEKDVKGMMNYGLDFLEGTGVKKDPKKAEELTKKAADRGCSEAQANYAYIHIINNPTPERINEGLICLRKAMDQKCDEAYCTYAYLLKKGIHLEKKDKSAMENFKKAADLENEDAMFEYALGNELGIGVPMNIDVAKGYYHLAAAKGNEEAKIRLEGLTQNNSSSTKSRKKKNDSTPIIFNDQLIDDDVQAEITKILDIDLPFQASSKVSLISLGKVVYDRPNYHTDSYIYPVGYQIERDYFSIDDPSKSAVYRATILDGGDSPLFKVECLDKSKVIFSGNTPSGPWIEAIDEIQKSREKHGILKGEKIGISGPKFFGLLIQPIEYLIDHLPNVDKCTKYIHKKLFVRGVDEEIKDGKEVVFMNYKGNNENVKTKRSFEHKRKKKSKSYRKKNDHNIEHNNQIANQIESNEPPDLDSNNDDDFFEQDEPYADESENNDPNTNDNELPSSDQNDNDDDIIEHNNQNSSEVEQDNPNPNDNEIPSSDQNDKDDDIIDHNDQNSSEVEPDNPNKKDIEHPSSDQNDSENDTTGQYEPNTKDIEHPSSDQNDNDDDTIEQDESSTNEIEHNEQNSNEIDLPSSDQNDSENDSEENNIEQDEQYYLREMIYNFNKPVDELVRIADEFYSQGILERAYRYYKEAANRGFPEAHIKCAEISPSLEDMIEHYELAISNHVPNSFIKFRSSIFKRAFNDNYRDKMSYFAQLFEKHEDFSDAAFLYNVLNDKDNFNICYEKAKKNIEKVGDGDQLYHFGLVAIKQNDFKLAQILLYEADEKGSEKAKKEIEKINKYQNH